LCVDTWSKEVEYTREQQDDDAAEIGVHHSVSWRRASRPSSFHACTMSKAMFTKKGFSREEDGTP
jgi:hypothetical protein